MELFCGKSPDRASGFPWIFYGTSEVGVGLSLAMTLGFFVIRLAVVGWIFRTGYRLKS